MKKIKFFILINIFLGIIIGFLYPASRSWDNELKWGVLVGPVTSTNAVLRWTTKRKVKCTVLINGEEYNAISKGNFHKIFLDDLISGTVCDYRIKLYKDDDKIISPIMNFRVPNNDEDPWCFTIVGDVHSGVKSHDSVQIRIVKIISEFLKKPLLSIIVGDLIEEGVESDWDDFYSIEKQIYKKIPLIATPGNHDDKNPYFYEMFPGQYSEFQDDYFKHAYYSFRLKNSQFVFLDSNRNFKKQAVFLENILRKAVNNNVKWKFCVFHHPPFTSGNHGFNKKIIKRWVPIFEKYNVTAVFNGHSHTYEHSVKNGVNYFVLGGGGADLARVRIKPNPYSKVAFSVHHFSKIIVNKNDVIVYIIDLKGKILDKTIIKKRGKE